MLSRRWIINFFLLALILVFTYIGNKYQVQPGSNPNLRVTTLKAKEVRAIRIKTADETLELALTDGKWHIESPIRWPASNINVERILDITRSETESRLSADEIDLDSIGLQFPRALLQLNDTQILFGGTNNIGDRRYIKVGSTVFLLPDAQLPFISQGLPGLVDRRLLPASSDLEALQLSDFEINRSGKGDWQIAGSDRFSADQLNRLVDNWRKLEASRIKPYHGDTTPKQKLLARLGQGRSQEFFVLSISPEIIIAHPQIGLQYHFNASYYYQLLSLPENDNSNN